MKGLQRVQSNFYKIMCKMTGFKVNMIIIWKRNQMIIYKSKINNNKKKIYEFLIYLF